jgi:DNA-binding NtrC family response regulator
MVPAEVSILVLEDEPSILRLVTAALQSAGFVKVIATSSIKGARHTWGEKDGKFDLLLTDFSLPDGSVRGLIEEFLAQTPELTVMLMTGFSCDLLDFDSRVESRMTLMPKPFRPSELCKAVVEHLNRFAAA